jgi:hypothetical protein
VVEWALLDKDGPLLTAQLAGPRACVCAVNVSIQQEGGHTILTPLTSVSPSRSHRPRGFVACAANYHGWSHRARTMASEAYGVAELTKKTN